MAYRRIGLARGGPQDWGQEAAAKQQGSANVAASNPYSQAAQAANRALNERVSREGRSNISRQNFQQGLKDFYKTHQGGLGGGIRNIGGGIRNFFGGLGDKFGAWAGKMRGGINPATGEYYTQDEYEQNRYNRQIGNRIDRLRKTRDTGKYANDPEGWAASDLSGRLAGFENQLGIKDYSRDTLKARDAYEPDTPINNRVNLNDFEGVTFDEGISKADPALTMMEEFYNTPIQKRISDATGYNQGDIELTGMNQAQLDYLNKIDRLNKAVGNTGYSTYAKSERYPNQMAGAFFEHQKPEDVWRGVQSLDPKSTGWVGSGVEEDLIKYGDKSTFAQPDEVTSYIKSLSPQDETYYYGLRKNEPGVDYSKLPEVATGGLIRQGYKTGGRVGILAAF